MENAAPADRKPANFSSLTSLLKRKDVGKERVGAIMEPYAFLVQDLETSKSDSASSVQRKKAIPQKTPTVVTVSAVRALEASTVNAASKTVKTEYSQLESPTSFQDLLESRSKDVGKSSLTPFSFEEYVADLSRPISEWAPAVQPSPVTTQTVEASLEEKNDPWERLRQPASAASAKVEKLATSDQ
jgi:hypothetical protein